MLYALKILHFFKKGVGVIGVEIFVTRHYGYEIFRFRKIDYVMRPPGNHRHRFDFIAADCKFHRFARNEISFPYKSVTRNNYKKFQFGIVPVVAFGNAGL